MDVGKHRHVEERRVGEEREGLEVCGRVERKVKELRGGKVERSASRGQERWMKGWGGG